MSLEHPLLGCTCSLCHSWRRVGFLLARSDTPLAFREVALRRVRELYTELLDTVEGLLQAGGPPVAVGVPPAFGFVGGGIQARQVPPVQPPACGGLPATVPAGVFQTVPSPVPVGPAQATCKAGPIAPPTWVPSGVPPEPAKEEVSVPTPAPKEEASKSPVAVERSPAKERKKKKDKKSKKNKHKDPEEAREPQRSVPKSEADYTRSSPTPAQEIRESSQRLEGPSGSARAHRSPDRTAPVREGEEKRRRSERRSRRRSSRRRSRSRNRERRRSKDSRGRGREARTPSPGVKDSAALRRHQRPPEPAGPPPSRSEGSLAPPPGRFHPGHWWQYRQWGSKGVKRRERQADIKTFGPDPHRKQQREYRDRGR